MMQYNWATVSKVIKSEVNTLQTEFQRLLGANLQGLYLHGSLALGGFHPARSDIDVITVVEDNIILSVKRELIEMLLRFSQMPCPLDVFFLVEKDLFPFQHPLPFDLHYCEQQRDAFQQDLRNGNWQHWNESIHRDPALTTALTILYQSGIVLAGKPIEETLPRVPEPAFRDALITSVQAARAELPRNPISFVLNACRADAYLQDGTILSKDEGGNWGLIHLPEQYHPLIQQSLALYRGERLGRAVGRAMLDDFAASFDEAVRKS